MSCRILNVNQRASIPTVSSLHTPVILVTGYSSLSNMYIVGIKGLCL